jgi:2-dehydropantoate 2-reductase
MARVAVYGAGLIGVYVGGLLADAGADVTLIGRPRVLDALGGGLRLTDLDGRDVSVAPEHLARATDPAALAGADLVLVTVKSMATSEAGADIAAHAPEGATILSLQNGVDNAERLAAVLPGRTVIAGMVPFNVAQRSPAHYHRGTGGGLAAAENAALRPYLPLFESAGMPLALSANMQGVMWGKLLVNLNNAINALSGVPLAKQLVQRDYRRAWALCMDEGMRLVRRAGIELVDPLPLPLRFMPLLMRLPNPLYRRVVARTGRGGKGARVDPHARSSMADDLSLGRATEVDHINGAVVRLAERLGRSAPVNARVIQLVRAAEAGAPPIAPGDLYRALRSAR